MFGTHVKFYYFQKPQNSLFSFFAIAATSAGRN